MELKVSESAAKKIIVAMRPRIVYIGGVYGVGKSRFGDKFKKLGFSVVKVSGEAAREKIEKLVSRTASHIPVVVVGGSIEDAEQLSKVFRGTIELFACVYLYPNNQKSYYLRIAEKWEKNRGKCEKRAGEEAKSAKEATKKLIDKSKEVLEEYKREVDGVLVVLAK